MSSSHSSAICSSAAATGEAATSPAFWSQAAAFGSPSWELIDRHAADYLTYAA